MSCGLQMVMVTMLTLRRQQESADEHWRFGGRPEVFVDVNVGCTVNVV
jgi:hypothetical protein